jgi:hypothetical protein
VVVSKAYCVVVGFFLRLVYPMFPVYLHCPQNTVVSKTRKGIQKWTMQRNWQHIVYKTKKKQKKTQHNMCWTPLYVNKNKQRKQDRCLFFFSPWHWIEQHESHWKLRVNSDAPEGQEVPNPLVNTRYLNSPMICWIFNVIVEQGCFCFVEQYFNLVKYLSISAKNWLIEVWYGHRY